MILQWLTTLISSQKDANKFSYPCKVCYKFFNTCKSFRRRPDSFVSRDAEEKAFWLTHNDCFSGPQEIVSFVPYMIWIRIMFDLFLICSSSFWNNKISWANEWKCRIPIVCSICIWVSRKYNEQNLSLPWKFSKFTFPLFCIQWQPMLCYFYFHFTLRFHPFNSLKAFKALYPYTALLFMTWGGIISNSR